MNYIKQLNAFNELQPINRLSPGQIALWYALIHVNNKCAWIEWFSVSNLTLELSTGLTRAGILKARNVLKQKGYIDIKSNGTKATSYKILRLYEDVSKQNTMVNSIQDSTQDSTQGSIQDNPTMVNSTQVGIQGSIQDSMQSSIQVGCTLNKQNKTKLNKEIYALENPTFKKPEESKIKYAEFISMTKSNYQKLIDKYGQDCTDWCINELNLYKGSSGKKYKSDYMAILKWVINKYEKEVGAINASQTKNSYGTTI